MRVLLDTNVVLDVLLERGDWLSDARLIWDATSAGTIECCLSASSLTDIFYIARKTVGWDQARTIVRQCLDTLSILAVDDSAVEHAYFRPEKDFEDAVMISVAHLNGANAIVTRDASGFSESPVDVLTPTELADRLSATDDQVR